jgi:pyridoxine 4-dehydrogenase
VERVDLYLIHEPDPDTPITETLDALDEVVGSGKARRVGASNVDVAWLEQARGRVSWLQNSYSLLDRESDDVLDYCADQGIAFAPFGPLGCIPGAGRQLDGRIHRQALTETPAQGEGGGLSPPLRFPLR